MYWSFYIPLLKKKGILEINSMLKCSLEYELGQLRDQYLWSMRASQMIRSHSNQVPIPVNFLTFNWCLLLIFAFQKGKSFRIIYVTNRILMFTIIQVSQDNRYIQGNIFPNVNILNGTCWLIYRLTLYVPSTFLRTLLLDIKLSLGTLVTPSTPTPQPPVPPVFPFV